MSSKRRIRRNQCGDKVRHLTAAAAKVALRKLRARLDFHGGIVEIYHCRFCKGYHVGHRIDQQPGQHRGRRP